MLGVGTPTKSYCPRARSGSGRACRDGVFSPSLAEPAPRCIPLPHAAVASAVREQSLSHVWTVDYALELLLIGGLVPEAVWLAHELGDWKTAVSIGVASQLSRRGRGFTRCARPRSPEGGREGVG